MKIGALMPKKPDTRYGGKPIYSALAGFNLDNEPWADGTVMFIGENRCKIESDVEELEAMLESVFEGQCKLPHLPLLRLDNSALIEASLIMGKDSKTLARNPLKVLYWNLGIYPHDFDITEWCWKYARSGETRRNTMKCWLMESSDIVRDFKTSARLTYRTNGSLDEGHFTITKSSDTGSEALWVEMRTIRGEFMVTLVEYSPNYGVNPETLYKHNSKVCFYGNLDIVSSMFNKRTPSSRSEASLGVTLKGAIGSATQSTRQAISDKAKTKMSNSLIGKIFKKKK